MILEYMQNLTEGISSLKQEINSLRERVEVIERRSFDSRKSSSRLEAPPGLLNPHKAEYSSYPKFNQPGSLKEELQSVLAEGIQLKTIEEGRREELKERHEAVYEEFKQLNLSMTQDQSYSPPPAKKSRWRRKKEKKAKKVELPEDLAKDLERAYSTVSKRSQ